MGVAAIVAPSFGRQFFRNAINNGRFVLECDTRSWPNGSSVRLDLQAHTFEVLSSDASQAPIVRSFRALPDAILAILREGGLIPFLKKYPNWEVPA
jgi:3-isopropylmalate dehydratase small subunit